MINAPRVVRVASDDDLAQALGPRPLAGRAVALVGGADGLGDDAMAALRPFFSVLAETLGTLSMALVDGGTDSGVMRLIGLARSDLNATFRLVGVAPQGAIGRRSSAGAEVRVATDHPEVLLVPGDRFGSETAWLFRTADHLGSGAATTIVVNGGQLTLAESGRRLAEGRKVIAVAGSGRAADVLAGTDHGGGGLTPLDPELMRSPNLDVVSIDVTVADLASALESKLPGGTER